MILRLTKIQAFLFRYWPRMLTYLTLSWLTFSNFSLQAEVRELQAKNEQLTKVFTEAIVENESLKGDMILFNRSFETFPIPTWQKVKRGDEFIMQYANPAYVLTYGHEFNYNRFAYIGKTDFDIHPVQIAKKYYKWDKIVALSGEPIFASETATDTLGNIFSIRVLKWREIDRKDTLVYGMVIPEELTP